MRESEAEVLVIGAGPTGLFVAGELARHGVRARIVDQSPAPHTQTRATGVQPAVLEVLHRAGLVDAFLDAGVPVKGLPPTGLPWAGSMAGPGCKLQTGANLGLQSDARRMPRSRPPHCDSGRKDPFCLGPSRQPSPLSRR